MALYRTYREPLGVEDGKEGWRGCSREEARGLDRGLSNPVEKMQHGVAVDIHGNMLR